MEKILLSHVGYAPKDSKIAIYQGGEERCLSFSLLRDGNVLFQGVPQERGSVARWDMGLYWTMDFSTVEESGRYQLLLETESGKILSDFFDIGEPSMHLRLISGLGYYFKAQRSTGENAYADSHLAFEDDRPGTVDAHGGWFDATGDYGIHLSHQSHTTWYNPQQASMTAYCLYLAAELLQEQDGPYTMVIRRLLDEGSFGADFLMRMQSPSGTFYRSIRRGRDAFMSAVESRRIEGEYKSFSIQFDESRFGGKALEGANFESSFRSGAGAAIAALAIAGRHYFSGTDYNQGQYIMGAKTAWRHLMAHNEDYTNDGKWNLVDEYCALLATVELYKTTAEPEYLIAAEDLAKKIEARTVSRGEGRIWLEVESGIPFHHPADEGMPIFALLQYSQICKNKEESRRIQDLCRGLMAEKLKLSEGNPFRYPAFTYLRDSKEKILYFFPHDTAAAPWWQGENARIASLASAAYLLSALDPDKGLRAFADAQVQWILGRNPFDSSMMEGYGRNQIQYFFGDRYDFVNCPGGVVNGITSGIEDEEGIAFVQKPQADVYDNWRWAEQWLPHGAWLLVALCLKNK